MTQPQSQIAAARAAQHAQYVERRGFTDADMLVLIDQDMLVPDIAAQLGVDTRTVLRVARANGREPRTTTETVWPDEVVARIREMHAAGLPFSQIARAVGRSKSAVTHKAHRIGLPARSVPPAFHGVPIKKPTRVYGVDARQTDDAGASFLALLAAALPPRPMPPALTRLQCTWLDGERHHTTACGAAVRPGTSWCPAHYEVVFTPVPQERRPFIRPRWNGDRIVTHLEDLEMPVSGVLGWGK